MLLPFLLELPCNPKNAVRFLFLFSRKVYGLVENNVLFSNSQKIQRLD